MTELLKALNNWFVKSVLIGRFTVQDGALEVPGALSGQYIRIVGSVLNDGVYCYPVQGLQDETFAGEVWLLAVPAEVVKLAADVAEWRKEGDKAAGSIYQSESFGGYTYNRGNTIGTGWQDAFASRLKMWRKL